MEKYERENTIKTSVLFKISGSASDPYNSEVNINVIRPDGSYLLSGQSAIRNDTGSYKYFISSSSNDTLGIYTIVWKAQHDVGGSQGLMPLTQRDYFQLVQCD